ncbi:MAG TPA: hypothetical protein VML92_04495 [Steroidobacteraceae bacterium]|nr:hypothetical protein [Steroidobacteraceae bacterium]
MIRRDWLMTPLAIEPDEARIRPSAVRLALNFEHVQALAGDGSISLSASPRGLPCGLRQPDIYLGIKTCH